VECPSHGQLGRQCDWVPCEIDSSIQRARWWTQVSAVRAESPFSGVKREGRGDVRLSFAASREAGNRNGSWLEKVEGRQTGNGRNNWLSGNEWVVGIFIWLYRKRANDCCGLDEKVRSRRLRRLCEYWDASACESVAFSRAPGDDAFRILSEASESRKSLLFA